MFLPRFAPPLGLAVAGSAAAAVAAVAFSTAWAVTPGASGPSPGEPAASAAPAFDDAAADETAAGETAPPAEDPSFEQADDVVVGEPGDPFGDPEENVRRELELEDWHRGDDLYVDPHDPLPDGTDTAPLLAGAAERTALLGDEPGWGGDDVTVAWVEEKAGEDPVVTLRVKRKKQLGGRSGGYATTPLAEWWRVNPDGSVTFLRAIHWHELTTADFPPHMLGPPL